MNVQPKRVPGPNRRSSVMPVQKAVYVALLLKYSARAGLSSILKANYFELWVLRIFLSDVFVLTRHQSTST